MVEVWLPYGKTEVPVRVPDENLLRVIKPREVPGVDDPALEIKSALEKPFGTARLSEMAEAGDKAAIVVDDVTRPAPTRLMLPLVLDELCEAGVADGDITIIFGCGTHRSLSEDEMAALIDDEVLKRVKAVCHDSRADNLVSFGSTTRGTEVLVNRTFAEAELKILTGDIGLHYYAGYGGGRKSVLPAVAGWNAVRRNHSLLLDPKARTGNLEGNPVHEDMNEAARMVGVDFTLNVVLNSRREVVGAFAGDFEEVLERGVLLVDEMCKVPIQTQADIVIVSSGGFPHDINLYQAYKAVDHVKDAIKDGGIMILVAECPEGYGNQTFYDWMVEYRSIEKIERQIRRNFIIGGHKAYYLTKQLSRVSIMLVSVMPDSYVTSTFRLKTAKTVNEALNTALRSAGKKSKIYVIPDGAATLTVLEEGRGELLESSEQRL